MLAAMIETDLDILDEMMTNNGKTLAEVSCQSPVLLVFLRHFGCVFCKEALGDLSARRSDFEKAGIRLVFVHMADDETAEEYFTKFNLAGVNYVCDPSQRYYAAFGLHRGTFSQLYGLRTWMRGFKLKNQKGYNLELAQKLGDSTQMPGVFVLQNRQILESFIHQYAAERPNYDRLVECCVR
jgi:peroxiredoxin